MHPDVIRAIANQSSAKLRAALDDMQQAGLHYCYLFDAQGQLVQCGRPAVLVELALREDGDGRQADQGVAGGPEV